MKNSDNENLKSGRKNSRDVAVINNFSAFLLIMKENIFKVARSLSFSIDTSVDTLNYINDLHKLEELMHSRKITEEEFGIMKAATIRLGVKTGNSIFQYN